MVDDEEKQTANNLLKLGNRLLKGEICIQEPNRAVADAITIKNRLVGMGMWWQAKNLDRSISRKMKTFK